MSVSLQQVVKLLRRKVMIWGRQSTAIGPIEMTGSYEHQLTHALSQLEVWGFKPEQIITVYMAESGAPDADRPLFEEALEMIRTGEFGLIIAARGDRLGRNDEDAARLYRIAEKAGAVFMIGNRLYDPADHTDRLMLGITADLAQWENSSRLTFMRLSRLAKSAKGEYRITLPAGLVWASPDDRVFVQRMHDEGLGHWLERLGEHTVFSKTRDRVYYILPFPDAQLVRSIELRLQWILETRDLSVVAQRIWSDPAWLCPRAPPSVSGLRFSADSAVRWCEIRDLPMLRGSLRRWFQSPALYGVYSYGIRKEGGPDA